jgi:hypothetical protein
MSDEIAAGRDAWARLRLSQQASWADWLAVGRALVAGRAHCMKAAQTNEAKGGRFNLVMSAWLADNGLNEVSAPERYRLIKIIEHLPAVEGMARDARSRRTAAAKPPKPLVCVLPGAGGRIGQASQCCREINATLARPRSRGVLDGRPYPPRCRCYAREPQRRLVHASPPRARSRRSQRGRLDRAVTDEVSIAPRCSGAGDGCRIEPMLRAEQGEVVAVGREAAIMCSIGLLPVVIHWRHFDCLLLVDLSASG